MVLRCQDQNLNQNHSQNYRVPIVYYGFKRSGSESESKSEPKLESEYES